MIDCLAVDVALIPPEDVSRGIIKLIESFNEGPTKLNLINCLPHITLAMGIIERSKLHLAYQVINKLAKSINEIPISIEKTRVSTLQDMTKISELTVELNSDILKLHADVMTAFKELLTDNDVKLDYFLSPPKVSSQSIHWVKNYLKHHQSLDNYNPHITLGKGILENLPSPIKFSNSSIALSHLGTYCTCRKILFQASYTSQ